MRVLQVEDDPAAAQAVERMMGAQGYACDTTAYGAEAVELATDNGYDLILLDIMLPDIDGYEVLRRLQAAGNQIPVLILSGMLGRDEMEKCVAHGAEDYLVKPFSRDELDTRIAAIMARIERSPRAARGGRNNDDRRTGPRGNQKARRVDARVRTLKSGQIIYNNLKCVADCLILDTSDSGAALQAADTIEFPTHFTLKEMRGRSYECEVCWQYGRKIGVRFV